MYLVLVHMNFFNLNLEVVKLPEFQSAKWVKVNPDRPQAEVRTVVF